MKRIMPLLSLLALLLTLCVSAALPFEDVPKDAWYYNDVEKAYASGIIHGEDETHFAPDDHLTGGEAVKLAAVIRLALVKDRTVVFESAPDGAPWYEPYVSYCRTEGILKYEIDFESPVTRGEFARLFAECLPEGQREAINFFEGAIPDVDTASPYYSSVSMLYRAGILTGSDDLHSFFPDSFITRAEVAAIITRMTDKDARIRSEQPGIIVSDPGVRIVKSIDPVVDSEGNYCFRYTAIDVCDASNAVYIGTKASHKPFETTVLNGDFANINVQSKLSDKPKTGAAPLPNLFTGERWWITDCDPEEGVIEVCTAGDEESEHYLLKLEKTPIIALSAAGKPFDADFLNHAKGSVVLPEQLAKQPKELRSACTDYENPARPNAKLTTKYARYIEAYIGIDFEKNDDRTARAKDGTNGDADYIVILVHDIKQGDAARFCILD